MCAMVRECGRNVSGAVASHFPVGLPDSICFIDKWLPAKTLVRFIETKARSGEMGLYENDVLGAEAFH